MICIRMYCHLDSMLLSPTLDEGGVPCWQVTRQTPCSHLGRQSTGHQQHELGVTGQATAPRTKQLSIFQDLSLVYELLHGCKKRLCGDVRESHCSILIVELCRELDKVFPEALALRDSFTEMP
jgi:hypothetical protein